MAGKQRRARYHVTPEQFVVAWNTAGSAQEAADVLGMPRPIVVARAAKYREAGVKLKAMNRGRRPKLDVDALNRLLEEVGEGPARARSGTDTKKRG
jgi:transposase